MRNELQFRPRVLDCSCIHRLFQKKASDAEESGFEIIKVHR